MAVVQPMNMRPAESVEDGRRWSGGRAEFSVGIVMYKVFPAEVDVLELGMKPAVEYAHQVTKEWEQFSWSEGRILHPTEYPKAADVLPPQHGKSHASTDLPAWDLVRDDPQVDDECVACGHKARWHWVRIIAPWEGECAIGDCACTGFKREAA